MMSPIPGKLARMRWSGCRKASATACPRRSTLAQAASRMPSSASMCCPNASSMTGGCRSCGCRSCWWMCAATPSRRRCRPPRLSAATIRLRVSVAPAAGVGAMARMARASVLARLGGVVGECGEEAGIELAEDRADLLQGFGPSPGRVLVGAGQHGDRLRQLRVARQRSVDVAVGAQNVGQQHGVGVVGLAACGRVAFPVAGDRHRVRWHRPASQFPPGQRPAARAGFRSRPELAPLGCCRARSAVG